MKKLFEKYKTEVIPAMKEKFGYKNESAVPKIEKVIINTGFGRLIVGKDSNEQKIFLDNILNDLSLIAGQRTIITVAKKSISSFKIRQGMAIGAKVTLRRKKMYDFLDRLINVALPRSRDFRGIDPNSVDKRGNLTIGIREHISFPEVSPEKTKFIFSFEVVITTTSKTREIGLKFLKLLGFPIKK